MSRVLLGAVKGGKLISPLRIIPALLAWSSVVTAGVAQRSGN